MKKINRKDYLAISIIAKNGQVDQSLLFQILTNLHPEEFGEHNDSINKSGTNWKNYKKRMANLCKGGHLILLRDSDEYFATTKGRKFAGIKGKGANKATPLFKNHRYQCARIYYDLLAEAPKNIKMYNDLEIKNIQYCQDNGCFPDVVAGHHIIEVELTAKSARKMSEKCNNLIATFPVNKYHHVWYVMDNKTGERIAKNIQFNYGIAGGAHYEIRKIQK